MLKKLCLPVVLKVDIVLLGVVVGVDVVVVVVSGGGGGGGGLGDGRPKHAIDTLNNYSGRSNWIKHRKMKYSICCLRDFIQNKRAMARGLRQQML